VSAWLAALLVCALAATARAAFEDLGAGGRAPGMGDAFVAIADDVYAVHYNPAGLGRLERPQFGAAYTAHFVGLTDNSQLGSSFLGYAHPLEEGRRGTLAAAWESFSLNSSLYREQSFALAYGRSAWKPDAGGELFLGAAPRYLQRSFGSFPEASNAVIANDIGRSGRPDPVLSGTRSRGALDADLGALYRFARHFTLGAQLAHVLQPNVAFSSSDRDTVPMALRVGLDYGSLVSHLSAQIETRRAPTGTRDQSLAVGAERWFPKLFVGEFGLRGGLDLGSRDFAQLCMGVSFRTRRLTVDYGFGIPLRTVSSTSGSHRVAVGFRFGRTTDQEESLEMVLEAMRQLKSGTAPAVIQADARGLSLTQRAVLDERLAQTNGLERVARFREASEKMTSALAIAPSDPAVLGHFSRLNFIAQQYPELTDYQTKPAQAALHRGLLAYLAGEDQKAVEGAAEAVRLEPKDKELDAFLTQLERVTGRKRMPVSEETKPVVEAGWLAQAERAIRERRYDDAVEAARGALAENPSDAAAWEDLGTAYFAMKDYPRAYEAWRNAHEYEKSPSVRDEIKGYMNTIELVLRRRGLSVPERRRAAAAPAPAPAPASSAAPATITEAEARALYQRGVDAFTRRDFAEAKAAFEEILRGDPGNVEAANALRRVLEEAR
jgi:tetratricopeptide (TPR) repeat protein